MATSTAYVRIKENGWTYTFDGVISIAHSLSLKVATDSDSSVGSDYVNNARNEPDVVTLTVVASDANVNLEGWSAQTFRGMVNIKERRNLCYLVTTIRAYDNMLLTDISAIQDETCPDGWTGSLTFTHSDPQASNKKTDDNASTRSSPGQTGADKVTGSEGAADSGLLTTLQELLRAAGIKGL